MEDGLRHGLALSKNCFMKLKLNKKGAQEEGEHEEFSFGPETMGKNSLF
jgi:hypothetical protein